jgi:hypothetical protein
MWMRASALTLALCGVALAAIPAEPTRTLALQGATLIDGTGAPPVPDSVVLVRGGRVVAAGPRSTVQVPADATRVALDGKYIIPGLIDAHVHYWDWNAELMLWFGVTSIVDMGNFSDYIVALSDSIEKGYDIGPRIYGAGEFLRGPKKNVASLQAQVFPKNPEEARAKVRELVGKGMKFIKVMQDMPIEHLVAVVDEARKLGVPVVGHSDDVVASIGAGLNQVVHDMNIGSGAIKDPAKRKLYDDDAVACPSILLEDAGMDELVALMVKKGVYYSPTFVTRYKMFSKRAREQEQANQALFARSTLQYVPMDVREGIFSSYHRLRDQRRSGVVPEPGFTWADEFSPKDLEEYRQCYAKSQEFLRRFVVAGGKVNSGTDTPSTSVPGAGLHHEMEMEAESGMTPMQVLQATTVNTATLFRLKDVGTLEPGKFADLVVLSADPLADISNTQKIERVFKGGQEVERKFHKAFDPIIKRPMDRTTYVMPELYRPSTFIRRGLIYDLKPGMVTEGSGDVAVTIDGIGFSGNSVARIGTSRIETDYLGPETLRVHIPARLLQVAGTYPMTVESPPPGGGVSNVYGFIVRFK